MKARFVDNEGARALVTIREDDLIWRGQKAIDPVPAGAIVRAFIPSDAKQEHVDEALKQLEERAHAVAKHRMPREGQKFSYAQKQEQPQQIREVVLSMATDGQVLGFLEEALSKVGL